MATVEAIKSMYETFMAVTKIIEDENPTATPQEREKLVHAVMMRGYGVRPA